MVFCTYCGQSFTRDEHLERHILTHTNVKPFKCFTCHMSFARRDLLQRHYTVHGRDQNQEPIPASNGMIPKSAGRTPIACSNCAKTKTKCDKKFPCSRCAGRNLKCTLRPTRRATKNAARMGIPVDGVMPPNTQAVGVDASIQPDQSQSSTTTATTMSSPTHRQSISPQQMMKTTSPKTTMAPIPEEVQLGPAVSGHPVQFIERIGSGSTSTVSSTSTNYSPPVQTPGFGQPATFSTSFDGLGSLGKDPTTIIDDDDDDDDVTSPRFMLDWSQMQIPIGYDGMVPIMGTDLSFDPTALNLAPGADSIFGSLMYALPAPGGGGGGGGGPLLTPNGIPRVDSVFQDLDFHESGGVPPPLPQQQQRTHSLTSSHASTSPSTSASSTPDLHLVGGSAELAAIVAAQDAWPAFRCTPVMPTSSCPRTARLNLERLEQTLRNQQGWSTWSPPQCDEAELKVTAAEGGGGGGGGGGGTAAAVDHLTVMQLHESTRDKLLAITQSFLHKALEIHRDGGNAQSGIGGNGGGGGVSNFVLLPPARVLEYFLRSYVNCFERYFPVTGRGTLDVNELMHCYNDRAASLLVLMMIAQGAMNIPSTEARMLTGGLTEACRISLFDVIEKDIVMAGDHIVLHAALLFTVQAAWSGDKWQMDIAMGQRGMYLAMLRHSGLLENRSIPPSRVDQRQNTDHLWSEWIQNEARSRLVYSWVMVDQDMALFHDTAPLFSVTEFHTPMPDADHMWHAKGAAEWSMIFEQVHEFAGGYSSLGSGARPLSLKDLFRHFLDDEMIPLGIETTPLQLRLLLHPLQSLVCQFTQLLNCFSEPLSDRDMGTSRAITAVTTRHRLEEVQSLLQRWYDLAERYLKANSMCTMMRTNLAIYHLISLNAVTNFPDIERLARRETFDGSHQKLIWLHKNCIFDAEEAIFHCGQVLRLVRGMPRSSRPPWWAGALYRVTLILWADSLVHKDSPSPGAGGKNGSGGVGGGASANMLRVPGPSFAIDVLHADHPLIVRYLTKREGVPCVTKRDGSQMPLDRAYNVLQHCLEVIDEGVATRFSDGIRAKLDRLARG